MSKQDHFSDEQPHVVSGLEHEVYLDQTQKTISQLIGEYRLREARQILLKFQPNDIAKMLSQMPVSERIIAFRILPHEQTVLIFSYMDPQDQEAFLQHFSNQEVRLILEKMDPDDRTEFLEELPGIVVKRLLKLLSVEERKIAAELLNYKEDTAGRIMTPDYVDLLPTLTVEEALQEIKNEAPDKETIYNCYVVTPKGKLIGEVQLKDIILAKSETLIETIMKENPLKVHTMQDQEEVVKIIKKYDKLAVPVVGTGHRLVGIITVDDVIDVLEEENTEDFQLIAGMQPTDEGYIKSNFWKLIFNRSIWIVLLLMVQSLSQEIIKSYHNLMTSAIALSYFFTTLIGVGGNIGAQSSVLVIRGIATGEISRKDTMKLLWRSFSMGIVMGVVMAVLLYVRIILFHTGESVRFVVPIALAVIVAVSNFLGTVLPIIIKRLGVDPALISSPLITTLTDVGGLVIYFEIAKLILKI